jgi:ankyrin repeat protein
MPWTFNEWTRRTPSVIQWIFEHDHCALLRHIEGSNTNALTWKDRRRVLVDSAKHGRLQFIDILDFGRMENMDLGQALRAAAGGGHLDVVERLLAAKADVNAATADEFGRTALQAAAGGGHLDVVERLLAAKADVNAAAAAAYSGRTALQAAAEGGHLDVVERLLAGKADVNPFDKFGRTALQAAAGGGHLDVVERLLAAKADVNPFDEFGRTVLQAAAGGGHLDVVERLKRAGAA